MKKALWPAIAIIAVANLITLLGFIGFLRFSDRLNRDRLHAIRAILATTITQEQQQAEADEKAAQAQTAIAQKQAETDQANAGAEVRNEQFRTVEQGQREIMDRARGDQQAIFQLLALRLAEVERREAELARREKDVTETIERDRRLARDAQFQKALSLLAGLKPDALKAKIDVYLADERYDLVVDLLQALPARSASRLLALYASDTENRMAAELLLRLKDRGTGAASAGTTSDQPPLNQQP